MGNPSWGAGYHAGKDVGLAAGRVQGRTEGAIAGAVIGLLFAGGTLALQKVKERSLRKAELASSDADEQTIRDGGASSEPSAEAESSQWVVSRSPSTGLLDRLTLSVCKLRATRVRLAAGLSVEQPDSRSPKKFGQAPTE